MYECFCIEGFKTLLQAGSSLVRSSQALKNIHHCESWMYILSIVTSINQSKRGSYRLDYLYKEVIRWFPICFCLWLARSTKTIGMIGRPQIGQVLAIFWLISRKKGKYGWDIRTKIPLIILFVIFKRYESNWPGSLYYFLTHCFSSCPIDSVVNWTIGQLSIEH